MARVLSFLVAAAVAVLADPAVAAPRRAAPVRTAKLVTSTPYAWPAYAKLAGRDRWSLTADAYARVTGAGVDVRRIRFTSGRFTVAGFLARPPARAGVRLPVIIYCRGDYGPDSAAGDHNLEPIHESARLAAAGYIVLMPQYRGHDGGGGVDELGGAEVDDVHALAAVARGIPDADVGRLFVYGVSRGTLDAMIAVREGLPALAIAITGPVVDWRRNLTLFREAPRGVDWTSARAVERRSMAAWAAALNVPILILQGGADRATPPDGALALASALEAAGAVYELAIIAGGDHGLSRQRDARFEKLLDWYARPRKQSVALVVERALERDGPAGARAAFAATRKAPARFELAEVDLNVLGYIWLGRGKLAEAIAVFELVTRAFPRSANAWDSLGEARAIKGDRAGALAAYRRALALDPAMPSARAAVQKLAAPAP